MRLTIINEVADDAPPEDGAPRCHRCSSAFDDMPDRHDFIDAVGKLVAGAAPEARRALSRVIRAWRDDDFYWIVGPAAPVLLRDLFVEIDVASRPRDGEAEALRAAEEAA